MKSKAISNSIFLVLGAFIGAAATVFLIPNLSLTSGSPGSTVRKVSNIAPAEVSNMINKYHDQWFNKLKVETESGDVESIETIIIQDSIFMNLKNLTERAHPEESFAGIGLSLAQNEFGSTTIVSALIHGNRANEYLFLIPDPTLPINTQMLYFYDHLDICPDLCPQNNDTLRRM